MSILSLTDVASSAYRDTSWKDIFCSAGSAVSSNAQPLGLINKKNVIMVPDNFYEYKDITICFPCHCAELIGENIHYSTFPHSLVSGIAFLKVNTKNQIQKTDNICERYISFLYEIVSRVYLACNTIFKYTYEHLSHRYVGDSVISKISIIQYDFSVVYLTLEKLALAVKNFIFINDMVYCTALSIEALHILARLAGARSVLRNRAVELMYHLKIFERFILDVNDTSALSA